MIKKYFFASFIFLFLFISNAQAQAISSFTPTSGSVGTSVTITGSNTTDFTGATLVTIGGTAAQIQSVFGKGKKLSVTVGAGTTGNIAVTLASGVVVTSIGNFHFIPLLQITSFTPTIAASGATVTITGTGFIGAASVTIGGTNAASFNVVNATTITAVVGSGASGLISVTVGGVTATLVGFTYNSTPTATAQSVTLNEDAPTAITLAGTDVEGTRLTYNVAIGPTNGALSGVIPLLTYTPNLNFNGSDSFTFTVSDGATTSTPATISITVTNVNDAPTFTSVAITSATEDILYSYTVTTSDPDGDAVTLTPTTIPSWLTLSTGRVLSGTPTNDNVGANNVVLTATDATSASTTQTFTITVTNVNDAPIATAQSVTTDEDVATPITLRGTDVDAGANLIYTTTSVPTKGVLSGVEPNLTYTPTPNLNGDDSFTFIVSDGTISSSAATVSITITPVNDVPVATAKSVTLNEDTPTAITLAGTDVEGTTLTYTVALQPTKGILSGVAPNLTYTPTLNLNGDDSFTFTVSDGTATSTSATVSITITPVNDAPTFSSNAIISATQGIAYRYTITTNDPEEGVVTLTATTIPSWLILSTGGVLSGTPTNLNVGAHNVVLTATDATNASRTQTFTITVTNVNDAPIATLQSVTLNEDVATPIILSGTDVDAGTILTYTVVIQPTKGTISGNAPSLIYTPTLNLNGEDSFTFTVNDGTISSSAATVSITITPVNDVPVATAQSVTTAEDVATPITLAGTDVENSGLTYALITLPVKGRINGTPPNLTYIPNLNISGSDSLIFIANDGTTTSTSAKVSITITPVNDVPVATAQSVIINEDIATPITLRGADIDEGTALTYTITTPPTKGILSGDAPSLTFTPTLNLIGNESFTFTVSDGVVSSSEATISITINPVNDPPSFTKGSNVTVQQNSSAYSQAWGTNISKGGGIDENIQSLTFITTNSNNTLFSSQPEIRSTGELRFTPATNQSGSAIITTSIRDNGGTASGGSDTSETQTFTITILSPTTIISFTPSSGITGTVVIITGTNFIGTTSVKFGGTNASLFTVDNATSIRAIIGSGTSGVISITTPSGTASSTNLFTHLLIPTITSFSPNVGGAGTSVIITGTNFTGATIVKIGGVTVSSFTVDSSTTITAVVGSGATGIVSVTTPSGTTTSNNIFTYYPKPTITSFTPTIGITSTTITITGTNLLETNSVKVGGKDVSSFTVDNATSIQAVVGDVSTGTISVITFGGTATSSNIFSYYSAPTISSFAPASGTMGSTITITGTNLLEINSINFGGTPAASYNIISATSVTALIGSGNSGTISLVTPGGSTTSTNSLTFTQPVKEITITYPNGGENFNADSIKNIRWTSSGVLNVNINYSINAGLSWTNITSSTPSDGSYSWEIPDTASINCLIKIIDINNSSINDISDNIFTIYKQPVIITNNHKIIFGDTKKTTSFKMVSIPGDNNKLINHYLTGTHKTDWNVFWDNGGNSNFQIEFNGSETFIAKPGRGFWILSNSEMLIKETIKSVTLSDDATCSIPLHNNWNIIGSPFEINVNWANVRTKNSLLNNSIIYYWDGVTWAQSTIMEPFKAYFYFNAENKPSLKIPYPESPGGSALLLSQNIITISLGENKAYAVFDRKYKSSYDENDILYPLSGYENTAVCIINDSFNDRMKRMFAESRNNIEGEEFRIEVINKSEKAQSLRFNLEDYKFSNSIYLIDEKYGNVFDLRLKSEIIIPSMKDAKYYKLLVGSKMYINEKLKNLKPKQFALHQNYPNPFNPTTTIKYDLPQDASTTITIYSILGQEVKTLVNGFEKAGFNNIVWDGTNDLGNKVATGVYIYKIRAGKFTSNKKMIMLK